MAVKDRDKHYTGLAEPDSVAQTPNTVSRNLRVGDRAYQTTVMESGKPVLDADLQVGQDASWWESYLLRRWTVDSGWLRGQTHFDVYNDYVLETAPTGVVDDSPLVESIGMSVGSIGDAHHILGDRTIIDAVLLPRIEAVVGGRMVVVEFTNTRTQGYNLVTLEEPTIYDGTEGTVKRTDFVFLECWLALVAPSPKATGSVTVADASSLVAGDVITINGLNLTATLGVPGVDEFLVIPADNDATATNIATALNDSGNSFSTIVEAQAFANVVQLQSTAPGFGEIGPPPSGNYITLAVTTVVIGALSVSGPHLTGGEDRPNKPINEQDKLFRHGNVLSAPAAYLDDVMVDPIVNEESSQRVQLQYRLRATGVTEAVNYKKYPDGFSTKVAGPTAGIFAQGARATPASNVSGRYYPFVPADQNSVWGNSTAVEYGTEDNGLWIAGDGSEQSAKDLGTVDGFVYAIPLCFVFRHNDVSSDAAAFKGFDPVSNTNGAPRYQHLGYSGPLGAIPAGVSDRPDGEYSDVITQSRLFDLRRHVMPTGADLTAELTYQVQSLLDGSLRTWQVDTASKQTLGGDSGDVSTRYLICNEVGRIIEGSPPLSGDTQRGETIRSFDHVARRFGDQPVVERVVIAFYPGDREVGVPVAPATVNPGKYVEKYPASPATEWNEGDILHLDLDQLDVTTLGGIFQGLDGGGSSGVGLSSPMFTTYAPPGTKITDVLSMYHDDGHYTVPVDQQVQATIIQGLGTDHLTITLDRNDQVVNGGGDPAVLSPYKLVNSDVSIGDAGSPRRIFVEVEITYPLGSGTTDTPDHEVTPDALVYDGSQAGPGPQIENDTTQRPNDFEALLEPKFREGYREVMLEYVANDTTSIAGPTHDGDPVGSLTDEYIVSRDEFHLYFPRRMYGTESKQIMVTPQVGPAVSVNHALTEYGSSSRKAVLSAGTPLGGAQTLCAIQYFPQDPIPNYGVIGGGYQIGVYFRSNAVQTAGTKEGDIMTSGDGVLPTTLRVEPLSVGQNIWTGQVGMGSLDQAFPYGSPLEQIPINDDPATHREWYFCSTASITIDDFNADTGLLALHPFVQADVQNVLEFGGTENWESPRKDAEFRAYYPFADTDAYRPTVMSQPLFGATRHKVFVPMLCRATADVPGVDDGLLFRKNELLLVVISRFAELDDDNTVRFIDPPDDNRTCAALYRTRNMLLVVGPRSPGQGV